MTLKQGANKNTKTKRVCKERGFQKVLALCKCLVFMHCTGVNNTFNKVADIHCGN